MFSHEKTRVSERSLNNSLNFSFKEISKKTMKDLFLFFHSISITLLYNLVFLLQFLFLIEIHFAIHSRLHANFTPIDFSFSLFSFCLFIT